MQMVGVLVVDNIDCDVVGFGNAATIIKLYQMKKVFLITMDTTIIACIN